ncbi:hypothetical protein [Acinetobacter sp.]|uniref:hypothetical protein n=1 Tax=Acinetobacter sp. TaxID=472 RepID=UPI0037532FB1
MSQLQSLKVAAEQAVVKITKANEDLNKTLSALGAGATAQQDLINQIAQKEADLGQLEVQFNEKQRAAEVKFDLDLKARQAQIVTEVLASQGKTVIDTEVLNKLRTDYQTLTTNYRVELEKEVNEVKRSAEAGKAAAIRTKELELQVASAEQKAQITSLNEKNTLLAQQVDDYKVQIAEDREARVQEAQARGNAVVNVSSGK